MFLFVGRMDFGLESYGRYVCQGIAARARDTLAAKRQAAGNEASELSHFFYTTVVMRLFQHIANIVEQRGKLVERPYGEGRNERL